MTSLGLMCGCNGPAERIVGVADTPVKTGRSALSARQQAVCDDVPTVVPDWLGR